ncbi:flagellar basal body P-ring formation chaperone FlgA [Sulfurimonas gotlandica]|nr:flagellar basal body P-ring formation chaperone FlgA [Sulfurimonas gotlandica]EDZ62561.1 flageller protein FlgA [Sulfurimonas gotlandica GD1]
MLTKFIFFILLSTILSANNIIQSTYYVNSNDIYLSHIIKDAPSNKQIYKIKPGKYTKRVRSKDLLKTLKKHGYRDFSAKSMYVKFIKKSPIDTSKIALYIKEYYLNNYDQIDIKEIKVESRGYIATLPKNYSIEIRKKNYLSKSGIVNIKTSDNKKIFFNYTINANILIYLSNKKINRDTELSPLNTVKKSILLDNFMAKPIQNIDSNALQGKHNIKKDEVITTRDVEILSVVKRDSFIDVSLNSKNMSISFSAKALQDGKLGDTITVQKSSGKRLKVRVTGKNRAEMR